MNLMLLVFKLQIYQNLCLMKPFFLLMRLSHAQTNFRSNLKLEYFTKQFHLHYLWHGFWFMHYKKQSVTKNIIHRWNKVCKVNQSVFENTFSQSHQFFLHKKSFPLQKWCNNKTSNYRNAAVIAEPESLSMSNCFNKDKCGNRNICVFNDKWQKISDKWRKQFIQNARLWCNRSFNKNKKNMLN